MKNLPILLLTSTLMMVSCAPSEASSITSESQSETSSESSSLSETSVPHLTLIEKYKLRTETSILADHNFKHGFSIKTHNPTNCSLEEVLDYNGEASKDFYGDGKYPTYWEMAQWWTPYNFKDAKAVKTGDTYRYQNESRAFEINPTTGSFKMELDSDIEYQEKFNGPLAPGNSWAHFLIEQHFPSELHTNLKDINNLHVKFDVTIHEATYKGDNVKPVGNECAQLLFYLMIWNVEPAANGESEKWTDRMWFGLPIFDSRYDSVPKYVGGDRGFEGATNAMIYSIPSKTYMGNDKVVMNKKYSIDIDVYEYIKEAFVHGIKNEYLHPTSNWNNLRIPYMNFGWELPGEYKVSSTIENLDIYVDPDF